MVPISGTRSSVGIMPGRHKLRQLTCKQCGSTFESRSRGVMYCSSNCRRRARQMRGSFGFYPAGFGSILPETLNSRGVQHLAIAVLDSAVKERDTSFLQCEESDMYFDLARTERDYFLRKLCKSHKVVL